DAIYTFGKPYARWGAVLPEKCVCVLMTEGNCSCLRAKAAHIPGHLPSTSRPAAAGKLGEGSDKSAPMIGIRTQSWDRRKHWPPNELVPRVHCVLEMEIHGGKELLMSETGIRGIDLFKIAGESISGWIPSWKMGGKIPTRQPFCSLM